VRDEGPDFTMAFYQPLNLLDSLECSFDPNRFDEVSEAKVDIKRLVLTKMHIGSMQCTHFMADAEVFNQFADQKENTYKAIEWGCSEVKDMIGNVWYEVYDINTPERKFAVVNEHSAQDLIKFLIDLEVTSAYMIETNSQSVQYRNPFRRR